jgi:hypothetical protein
MRHNQRILVFREYTCFCCTFPAAFLSSLRLSLFVLCGGVGE